MKGASFLKVTGILMIIGGVLRSINVLLSLFGIGDIAAQIGSEMVVIICFTLIINLASDVIELIAGIKGVQYANFTDTKGTCLFWGYAVIISCILSIIFISVINIPDVSLSSRQVGSLMTGIGIIRLIIPGLYVYGAYQNKNS